MELIILYRQSHLVSVILIQNPRMVIWKASTKKKEANAAKATRSAGHRGGWRGGGGSHSSNK
jgi:hypothetical protein